MILIDKLDVLELCYLYIFLWVCIFSNPHFFFSKSFFFIVLILFCLLLHVKLWIHWDNNIWRQKGSEANQAKNYSGALQNREIQNQSEGQKTKIHQLSGNFRISQTSGIIVKTMMVITKFDQILALMLLFFLVLLFLVTVSILMSLPPNLRTEATVFLQRDKTRQKGINSKKQCIH
jgi:chromate transport protein ChrA